MLRITERSRRLSPCRPATNRPNRTHASGRSCWGHRHGYGPAMRADRFDALPPAAAARWAKFGTWDRTYFPKLVGLQIEELRADYCRMRLPYRPELEQPAGLVHGGAIATLVDTVVVPAVGAAYDPTWRYSTLTMDIQYLGPVAREDAIAEGWVTQRGSSIVFCRAEVVTASGRTAATGALTYKVSPPR